MHRPGDAPRLREAAERRVERAQLHLDEHAARAEPAARDRLVLKDADEIVGEDVAVAGAEDEASSFFDRERFHGFSVAGSGQPAA